LQNKDFPQRNSLKETNRNILNKQKFIKYKQSVHNIFFFKKEIVRIHMTK